jgi:prepilin-type N-terminal cleavage/methylation domain-containing protein
MKMVGGRAEGGFTLIELLVAMAVFSFMLLIIVVGFINIVRLHNQALAANQAQDNARVAMDELVQAVRNSTGVVTPAAGATSTTGICLNDAAGGQKRYWIKVVSNISTLYKGDGCISPSSNIQPITNATVNVVNFTATNTSTVPTNVKSEIQLTISVASSNGVSKGSLSSTSTDSGSGRVCKNTTQDRAFCSVVTLTSGAVAR